MSCDHQRGTSTLAAVATLFSLGLFLLSALHRKLDNIQHITAEEQHHLRAFNQATSSLNWGRGRSGHSVCRGKPVQDGIAMSTCNMA